MSFISGYQSLGNIKSRIHDTVQSLFMIITIYLAGHCPKKEKPDGTSDSRVTRRSPVPEPHSRITFAYICTVVFWSLFWSLHVILITASYIHSLKHIDTPLMTTTTTTTTTTPAKTQHPPSAQSLHDTISHPHTDNNNALAMSNSPRRLLFIASIGNQKPYRFTRHSAGHVLLDALSPILPSSLPAPTYTTWYSPSYMNESGPKLVRQLQRWFDKVDSPAGNTSQWISSGVALPLGGSGAVNSAGGGGGGGGIPATLVILHDELEAPLGKVRVKRGGPEASSLRGHRGLISICESLRGKGLYPPKAVNGNGNGSKGGGGGGKMNRDLSILRVGVGIGRPESRGKNAVADYVLTEMNEREMDAVKNAAGSIIGVLEEELFFAGQSS